MIGPVREFARSLVALVETRARLAANELEEQALRFLEIAVWAMLAMFFFGIATVFVALVIVLLAWDANRILAACLLAALFAGVGTLGAIMARRLLRERPRMLVATLGELEKDRERVARDRQAGP